MIQTKSQQIEEKKLSIKKQEFGRKKKAKDKKS